MYNLFIRLVCGTELTFSLLHMGPQTSPIIYAERRKISTNLR